MIVKDDNSFLETDTSKLTDNLFSVEALTEKIFLIDPNKLQLGVQNKLINLAGNSLKKEGANNSVSANVFGTNNGLNINGTNTVGFTSQCRNFINTNSKGLAGGLQFKLNSFSTTGITSHAEIFQIINYGNDGGYLFIWVNSTGIVIQSSGAVGSVGQLNTSIGVPYSLGETAIITFAFDYTAKTFVVYKNGVFVQKNTYTNNVVNNYASIVGISSRPNTSSFNYDIGYFLLTTNLFNDYDCVELYKIIKNR